MINLYSGKGAIGRIDVTWNGSTPSYSKAYYIKDHLGSIRRVVNTSGTIVNANEYYAYGDFAQSYTSGSGNNKYKFTGKERDTETNYDYFGARYYDSDLGRWLSVDPLSSKYPGWSPYKYGYNNPVRYYDPNGMFDTRIEIDEATGNVKNIVDDGKEEITGAIVNSNNETTKTFTFNDEDDAKALINSFNDPNNFEGTKNIDGIPITGIDKEFNEGEMVTNVLMGAATVIGESGQGSKLLATAKEGKRFGKMDYVQTLKNPNKLKIIKNTAYNCLDAGNYMWGMGMSVLGYSYDEAVIGSQILAFVKDHNLDSPKDQKAIYNGYHNQ